MVAYSARMLVDRSVGIARATQAILILAVALRIWNYATGRSLWLDEAMVATGIVNLSPAELFGRLPFNQMAPIGWLLLEKSSLAVPVQIEYSLRAVSLITGITATILFWRLARRIGGPWYGLAAVILFGLSPTLIQYSSMVKPYGVDAMFSVAILYCADALLKNPPHRLRLTMVLAVLGITCILLSFGGMIFLAATGLVLFAASLVQKDRRWSIGLFIAGLAWIFVLGLSYRLSYSHESTTIHSMTDVFWGGSFAPLPVSVAALLWYPRAVSDALAFLLPNAGAKVVALFFVVGCWSIARRDRWLVALIVTPFIVALLVSAGHAYPFSSRFLLFLAAPLIIGVTGGLVATAEASRRPALFALGLLVIVGLGPLALTAKSAAQIPAWQMEEIKPNLKMLAKDYRPGDQVMLSQMSERAYLLYSVRYGLGAIPYDVTREYRADPTCVYDDVRRIQNSPRSWIIFYHVLDQDVANVDFLVRALGHTGRIDKVSAATGSTLYRYTADPARRDAIKLPPSAKICADPRPELDFINDVMRKNRSAATSQGKIVAG